MPRDSKGNPYGIGSKVHTPNGLMTVCGFSVQVSKHDMNSLLPIINKTCQAHGKRVKHKIYRWTEVEVIDPTTDPYRSYQEPTMAEISQVMQPKAAVVDYADSVDTCMADVVQRTSGPDGTPGPFKAGAEVQISADKAVWGS